MRRPQTPMRAVLGAALLASAVAPLAAARAQQSDEMRLCTTASAGTPEHRLESCTAVIEAGTETSQNLAIALYNRGSIYLSKPDNDRAIADFDEAIRLDPGDARFFNNRGRAYSNKGQYDRAIADYDQAIAIDPAYGAAFNNRGSAYRIKGQYDRAIADYDRTIELRPDLALAFTNRGIAYQNKGDRDRAIQDFK